MNIILQNQILLPDLPERLESYLCDRLTIQNPKWVENNRQGRWNKGVPEKLYFFEKEDDGLLIPRGVMRELINACHRFDIPFTIDDRRRKFKTVGFEFTGHLKPFQQTACDQVLKKHFGVLTAPTGAGKTVMMLYIIAQRQQPALIIVHTRDLAEQWLNRIETFLGIPKEEIGFIGGGKHQPGDKITVAMVQTLYKKTEEVAALFGNIVVDECHRTPSRTFTEALKTFDSYYMTGLSATPFRRDKLSKLIFWHLGDRAHEIPGDELITTGDILRAEVIFRNTDFYTETDPVTYYTKVMQELVADDERNRLIAGDVAAEVERERGVSLVLSDRKAHCENIRTALAKEAGVQADVLTGDCSREERQDILERLERGEIRVLIATSQLLGEGFDSKRLSTLFLGFPIKFSGRLLQYLGRVLRPGDSDKKARVFDYVDHRVGVLESAAKSRYRVYLSGNSNIILPDTEKKE